MMRRALGIALCAAWAGTLHAAHPFLTDDTGTQGAGHWQLELLLEHQRNPQTADLADATVHQLRKVTSFSPVLTYGLRDALDIALGLNYSRQRSIDDGTVTHAAEGTGDTTLELKWRLYERNGLSFGLKPGLVLPTGDETRGLGTGKLSWGINSILTQELERWTFLANLSYASARYKLPEDAEANHAHLWRASAGFAYALREDLQLVGEAGLRTNSAKDDPFMPGQKGHFVMLGVIYSLSDDLDLDLGVRRRHNSAEFHTAVLIGATLRW
ncbi:MAG: hypothetical protein A3G81_14820 [Betaproteobacteria bacterium RIFCSPLOWO2_12_FULL_65_14]|nr:MAG: hypothetical protein A3G81_14820 [Betaproteobacteria bacterium RIFCSPLOWO2_12_FULL_65_14]